MDDPTAQLRARARAGDADAFGAVFDACAKSVYNHAFRLTRDWSTAEEVMAMTFLFADDVSGRLDDVARIKALHRALADLPGPELEVLALCVWSGLSYANAAEALHVPVGTVRSRLSRARAKLARLTDGELRRPDGSAAHKNSREPTTTPDQLVSRPQSPVYSISPIYPASPVRGHVDER